MLVASRPRTFWITHLTVSLFRDSSFSKVARTGPGPWVTLPSAAGWGRIVNTSSEMGIVSAPGNVPYGCVKAGLIAVAKGAALEEAEYGVTCNAICPGFVETDRT
ncbi:BDHA-like protein [Mya arenaria]|uniref:3-oxoacyl-[acyl-carrier-protein] reductase n=1 Tax=Mya arenaria TaxID=6604 RepID=A0ABY7G4Z6_MYAAR|nr:BDHA-like protein [Mya arenaria]